MDKSYQNSSPLLCSRHERSPEFSWARLTPLCWVLFLIFIVLLGNGLTAPSKAVKKGRHEIWPGSGSRCVGGQMRTMYNGILSNKWEGREKKS